LMTSASEHYLKTVAQQMAQGEFNPKTVSFFLGQNIDHYTDSYGRVTEELQKVLYWIEDEIFSHADTDSVVEFQRIVARVGGKVHGKILLPKEDVSFWELNLSDSIDNGLRQKLLIPQDRAEILKQFPFAEFHTHKQLSAEADVVIIGAGLTGANVMFHLLEAVKKGLRVVIVDSNLGDAASFRNGGNFEAMPESFLGEYKGLREERVKYLRLTRPYLSEDAIQNMATEQADWMLRWCAANVSHIMSMIDSKAVNPFASPNGWLRMAETAVEDVALQAEVEQARKLGLEFEYWDKERIQRELKIPAQFGGRMAIKSGNYHPGRLITQLLKLGINSGVEFHTKTRVTALEKDGEVHVVKTSMGNIKAKHVVIGTNGFTRDLIPAMAPVIHPFQSHIANWEHVPLPSTNPSATATWTWNLGDGYGHFRWETIYVDGKKQLRGMFHIGGGLDSPAATTSMAELERNPQVFETLVSNMNQKHPSTVGQPPSRFSTGIMGFTPDRFPVVGALDKNLWIAAGYNGYGGSWSLHAAYEISQMILTGHGTELYNDNFLSPTRFFDGTALNPLGRPFANDDACAIALSKKKE
jgi:glycine/D-amino acid oxidase-like deaminating enzyme